MARKKKDGTFVNCFLRNDLVAKINEYSEKNMRTKTSIIEEALINYFKNKKV